MSNKVSKIGDAEMAILDSIPRRNSRLRNLVIAVSTSVGLALAGAGGFVWYQSHKNEEETLKAEKLARSLESEEKKPKELTKAEKEFAQKAKKLTVNEEGEIAVYTTFSKAKDWESGADTEVKEVSTDKEKPVYKPSEPVSPPVLAQIKETPPPAKTPPKIETPPPKIVREDGSVVLTGRLGETEELAKILRHVFANDARKKQEK